MSMTLIVTETEFLLKKDHIKLALDVLDRMENPIYPFAWFHPSKDLPDERRLEVYFAYVGFNIDYNKDGDLDCLHFVGDKWSWQDKFFQCLSKYVNAGSYINLVVEGDMFSQFYFNGDCMIEKEGKVIYE